MAIASAIEYLWAEVLRAAGDITQEDGFKRIKPRHITLAVKNDEHLNSVFGNARIYDGGFIPHIEPEIGAPTIKRKRGPLGQLAEQQAKAANSKNKYYDTIRLIRIQ